MHVNIPDDDCDELIARIVKKLKVKFTKASYCNPLYNVETHEFQYRPIQCYTSTENYYAVTFHELAHATAKKLRPDLLSELADMRYRGIEECTAELTAQHMVTTLLDTDSHIAHSRMYIKSWAKHLQGFDILRVDSQVEDILDLFKITKDGLEGLDVEEIKKW